MAAAVEVAARPGVGAGLGLVERWAPGRGGGGEETRAIEVLLIKILN